MMGDGLHNEPDGKWISREYTKIAKIVMPEAFRERAKKNRDGIDKQMAQLLSEKKSPCCAATLIQTKKGAKTCTCSVCNKKYTAVSKKK